MSKQGKRGWVLFVWILTAAAAAVFALGLFKVNSKINNLAGTAIWALGFQNDSVWSTLSETLAMSQEEASSLAEKLKQQDTAAVQDTAESSTEAEVPSSEAAVG